MKFFHEYLIRGVHIRGRTTGTSALCCCGGNCDLRLVQIPPLFRLLEAEKEAKALLPPPVSDEPPPTPEELSRFDQIAKVSPRAAILEYRRDLAERIIRQFHIDRRGGFVESACAAFTQ